MKQSSRFVVVSVLAIGAGMTLVSGSTAAGQAIQSLNARVVAINIPGASAIAQIGTFLTCQPRRTHAQIRYPQQVSHVHHNRARCWIRTASWSAADRISARRSPSASGRRGRSCRSIPTGPGILNVPTNFAKSAWRPGIDPRRGRADVQRQQPALAQQRQQLRTRTPLNIPGSATRSVSRTTTALAGFGRRMHRLAIPGSARPRSSIRPDCRSTAPRTPN